MSEFEQEIYALMGVSPLIRLDREFKDLKSILVEVVKPGEDSDQTDSAANSEAAENIPQNSATESIESSEEAVQATLDLDSTEAESSDDEIDSTDEKSESTANDSRRRRRRSSAQKEATV